MQFRVSEVESYRQFLADEDADVEAFRQRMRGLDAPSEAMQAGTAFHRVLELARPGVLDEPIVVDGHTFHVDADISLSLPAVREVRASRIYTDARHSICVSGQVDAIDGMIVTDHKTTAQFDPERYLAGYQWRFYLDIFGADVFRWNVFELKREAYREYAVVGFHRLVQYRYPGMRTDCERLALDLAEFAAWNLPERCGAPRAA
jgi:hypothetical protein